MQNLLPFFLPSLPPSFLSFPSPPLFFSSFFGRCCCFSEGKGLQSQSQIFFNGIVYRGLNRNLLTKKYFCWILPSYPLTLLFPIVLCSVSFYTVLVTPENSFSCRLRVDSSTRNDSTLLHCKKRLRECGNHCGFCVCVCVSPPPRTSLAPSKYF